MSRTKEGHCKKHGKVELYYEKGNFWRCKKCRTEYVTESRKNKKIKLVEAFGGECIRCGYNKCIAALSFHHLNPEEKEFSIATEGLKYSYERCMEEAKKCILVCSNCHTEIHYEEGFQYNKNKEGNS